MKRIALFADGTWNSPEQGEATVVTRLARAVTATLRDAKPGIDLLQVGFAGVHADVGGGYAERALGDIATARMIREPQSSGLQFEPHLTYALKPDFNAPQHNEYTRVHRVRGKPFVRTVTRQLEIPSCSARKRMRDPVMDVAVA